MFSMADESCSSNPAMVRRKKIAISIIFSLPEKEDAQRNFQDFFFSHFPLFESHMNKLKYAIEKVQNAGVFWCENKCRTEGRILESDRWRVGDACFEASLPPYTCSLEPVPSVGI